MSETVYIVQFCRNHSTTGKPLIGDIHSMVYTDEARAMAQRAELEADPELTFVGYFWAPLFTGK